MTTNSIAQLSDDALLCETTQAAADERHATARLIGLLMEVDRRRLYLARGYSSMFSFCTGALQMSEHAAYGRIAAARMSRRFPAILTMLSTGDLTLSSTGVLAPHLTEENVDALLDAARRKSTREVERLVAALYPAPDIQAIVRAIPGARGSMPAATGLTFATAAASDVTGSLPEPPGAAGVAGAESASAINRGGTTGNGSGQSGSSSSAPRAVVAVAAQKYLLRLVIPQETVDKLERARALLRHAIPDGDPALLLDRALALLVKDAERKQFAVNGRGRRGRPSGPAGRHIPAEVRRAVWKRDGGQCAFTGAGRRCQERSWLQLHHVVPYAAGGLPTIDNIQLRCRAHNLYEAARDFGEEVIRKHASNRSDGHGPPR